jgi:hypothetical protein
MKPVEPNPLGLKGAIGAADALLNAAILSLNELGFSATGGGALVLEAELAGLGAARGSG